MLVFRGSAILALAAAVVAQTPAQFPLTVTQNLVVTYNATNTTVSPPGVLLPRNDVLSTPTLYRPPTAPSEAAHFLAIMIDQDVSLNGTRVDFLHWMQPNLVGGSALTFSATAEGASSAVGASYIAPSPPTDGAHRYTFLLFVQPSSWTIPTNYSTINPPADDYARLNFNITDFIAASGLDGPIAGVFLRVLNGTAQETSANYSPTGTAAPATASHVRTVLSPGLSSAASAASASSASSVTSAASSRSSASAASSSAASTSASASASGSNAAASPEAKNSLNEIVLAMFMALVGAGAWML